MLQGYCDPRPAGLNAKVKRAAAGGNRNEAATQLFVLKTEFWPVKTDVTTALKNLIPRGLAAYKTLAKKNERLEPVGHLRRRRDTVYTLSIYTQSSEALRAPPFSTISTSCSVSSLSESVSRGHPFS